MTFGYRYQYLVSVSVRIKGIGIGIGMNLYQGIGITRTPSLHNRKVTLCFIDRNCEPDKSSIFVFRHNQSLSGRIKNFILYIHQNSCITNQTKHFHQLIEYPNINLEACLQKTYLIPAQRT